MRARTPKIIVYRLIFTIQGTDGKNLIRSTTGTCQKFTEVYTNITIKRGVGL